MSGTAVWAHQGSVTAGVRPNTVDAFLAAAAAGADGVELDVRRTADGALVVHHDPEVEGAGVIAELAVADLPSWVPLLDAAIDACGDMVVNVEIKNAPHQPGWDPSGSLAAQVAEAVAGRPGIIVSAFHLDTVVAARAAGAGATGWLLGESADPLRSIAAAVERGLSALHPWHSTVTGELVVAAHEAGLAVNTWTADSAADIERLFSCGVDAVITNDLGCAFSVRG